jgi:exonuclease I
MVDNPDTRVNNGKPYVKQYLNNCDILHLIMRNFTIKLDDFEVQGAFNLSQADNTAYLDKQTAVFFDKSDKFYCIYCFFPSNSKNSQMYDAFISDVDQTGTKIIAMVDKKELSDAYIWY